MTIQNRIRRLSYLTKSRPYSLEKPVVLQFPVIDICNSRCQMCKIWENKKSEDISLEDLRKGLRNPLFSEVRSVGLNGGEPTLRKDLGELTSVLFQELPKLRNVSLITNAFKYKEVIARIMDVGQVVADHGGNLDVMVSLDGHGDVHDRVRGKPGNFQRAQHVIDFVKSSPLVGSTRIGCTIIKDNVYGLADLFEYCLSQEIYIKYRLGIPHQRLYTRDLVTPYELSLEDRYHVAEFLEGLIKHYEKGQKQNFFYKSLIGQLIHGAPRAAGCDWQHRGATITSKGELLYCAVESDVLGKIQDDDSEKAYFGNQAHLDSIVRNKCDGCNHDYVGLPPKREQAKQIAKRLLVVSKLHDPLRSAYQKSGLGAYLRRQNFEKRLSRMRTLQKPAEATERSGVRKIMICGWYGTETLGDKGILAGVHEALMATYGDASFNLVSLHPYVSEMTKSQMPELDGWKILRPEQGVAKASCMDLVVFGGGPLMALNELSDMEAIFRAASENGVETLIAGCGVGPLGDPWQNSSITNILKLATHRIYRDEASRRVAAELGVDTRDDIVSDDPALTWLYSVRDKLAPKRADDRKVLLLGLRDFPDRQYASHLSRAEITAAKSRYEHAVTAALTQLCQTHDDLVIRPLPMCTNHFGDDDRWFYRRLFRGNKELEGRVDCSLLGAEMAPLEYCTAFKEADVALTMRFHSVVFALGLNVPTVAIDYTLGKGKVHALSERFGIPYASLDKLDSAFLVAALEEQLADPRPIVGDVQPMFVQHVSSVLGKTATQPKPRRVAAVR